ncbi:TonB family protein [Serratia quinivorans]|uniref:TonB family protein n=1 Tax=Serratia quinivorans TaxID=137545 RepID=UPI00217A94EB|nr:TonB family protein [Serratia quinivorans]CAI0858046.1 transport protein TonB [Serratia quinivorans]CAI2138115.1 transport protein TonB [Serratia quinivorans]
MMKSTVKMMLLVFFSLSLTACTGSEKAARSPSNSVTAQQKPQTDFARVKFDVDAEGRVQNIRLLESHPSGIFDNEMRMAMQKWRYESGKPTKDLIVNIRFKKESSAVDKSF